MPKNRETLESYIKRKHGGSPSAFAQSLTNKNGTTVTRQAVNKWLNAGYVVEKGALYSVRKLRDLN